jgi:hypothetical protein
VFLCVSKFDRIKISLYDARCNQYKNNELCLVVQGQPVTLEDSVMTVHVIMTLIAVNQQHPLYNDSSIGPRELLLRLFVPIGFLSLHFSYQH